MSPEQTRLRWKTWACAAVVIISNCLGNFLLKLGMPSDLPTPLSYITVLFHPAVAVGVILLILWMLSRMALLSWADLSYILPITAIGYGLVAFVSKFLLHENVTPRRWAGVALIMCGVALVGAASPPQTVERKPVARTETPDS